MSDFNKLLKANNITGTGGKDASGTTTTDGIDLFGDTNVRFSTNGFSSLNNNPFYFLRSGRVEGSTLYNFTGYGHYWSSTAVNGSYAYGLGYYSDILYPAYQNYRVYGWSLRCVARIFNNITGTGGKDASGTTTTDGIDLFGGNDVKYSVNGFSSLNNNPFYLLRSGSVYGTTLYNFTGGGYYWSSTAVSGSYAYYLYYNSGALYPAYQYLRDTGRSLRCVALKSNRPRSSWTRPWIILSSAILRARRSRC